MLNLKFWARKPEDPISATLELTIQEEWFQQIFGFVPSELESVKPWEQRVVDQKLAILAQEFTAACTAQEELLRQPLPSTSEEVASLHAQLKSATETVEEKEPIFWDAHGAANSCGFRVLSRHADYLPITREGQC